MSESTHNEVVLMTIESVSVSSNFYQQATGVLDSEIGSVISGSKATRLIGA